MNFDEIKRAATGRCGEIIGALTQLDPGVVIKRADDHPCPSCGGKTTVWPDSRDGGANEHGRIACRNCTDDKPAGDIIATVAAFTGVTQSEAATMIATHLGVELADGTAKVPKRDVVAEVCKAKHMPREAAEQFGAEAVTKVVNNRRIKVVRFPVYNSSGEIHSYFDLGPKDKGFFKRGVGSSGMFFPGRLPKPGEIWCIVEGVKDAAALLGLEFNACGLPGSKMPLEYASLFKDVHVVLMPDLDAVGQSGAQVTGGRLAGIAESTKLARLPGEIVATKGEDVRDVLLRNGPEVIRTAIDQASEWEPKEGDETADGRPEVVLSPRFALHCGQVIRHLGQLGWETPWVPENERELRKLYQRGGVLVDVCDEIKVDPKAKGPVFRVTRGIPRIRTLPIQSLPARIQSACELIVEKETVRRGRERTVVTPPRWLVEDIFSAGGYGNEIRPLEGIVTAPTIRPDGSILQSPGWDSSTGLLYRPVGSFLPVPEQPSLSDAQSAAAELLDVVADFPFTSDADRSAWLTMLLSMIARPCIERQVPLFAITANIAGAGKSMLVDVASEIAYGRAASRTAYCGDSNEMRKQITAIAIEATPAVLFDNLDTAIGGGPLDMAITSGRVKGRELGTSRNVDLPIRAVLSATGNNMRFKGDIARRVVPIRLNSSCEHPEGRLDFRHPDLLGHVRENRPELVSAALTLMRAYFFAGRPEQPEGQLGSFEDWSRIIRGTVVWAGGADPLGTRAAVEEEDESAGIVHRLIGGLIEIDEAGQGLTCRQIVDQLEKNPDCRWPTMRDVAAEVAGSGGWIDSKRLGYALRQHKERVAGGFKLVRKMNRTKTAVWSAVQVSAGDAVIAGDLSIPRREGVIAAPNANMGAVNKHVHIEGVERSPAITASPALPTGSEVEL